MANFSIVLIALTASFALAFGSTLENLLQRSRRQAGTCGQSVGMRANRRFDPSGQRIVGGVEARPNSHPWIISLQFEFGTHVCGGTLIRVGNVEQSDIVITAAHCVADGSMLYAIAGAHHLEKPQPGQQKVPAENTISHPDYSPTTYVNDIAIIKLATPIKFSATVQPACLPSSGETVPDNAQGTVAGWGHTREGAYDTSNILMQVGVPAMPHQTCASNYRMFYQIYPKEMLCAGHIAGGKDSCQGDSGGPLVFQSGQNFVLQGVVSFGEGCARRGLPGVYARVSNYIGWIQEKVKYLSTLSG